MGGDVAMTGKNRRENESLTGRHKRQMTNNEGMRTELMTDKLIKLYLEWLRKGKPMR